MARGKTYTNEEILLLQTLRRLEQSGICSKAYIIDTTSEITHRSHTAIKAQLSRMPNPKQGWAQIDKLLEPTVVNTPAETETITTDNILNHIGETVRVYCYEMKEYGAFCQIIGTSVQALLHISKISHDYVENVQDWVAIGDNFNAIILPESRPDKVALSTKGMLERKV